MTTDIHEGLPSGSWALLGLELWGARPLGYVRMPLIPDRISVLYGLNGAGKSTVLTAVRSALRGTCTESPFLQRFRIHAELRDPQGNDALTDLIGRRQAGLRLQMLERSRADEDSPRPAIRQRGLHEADPLRVHLERITEDPCCTTALADGLRLPNGADTPLRVTLTVDDKFLSVAAAARPDGSSFNLLQRLMLQEAASDPADPIVAGSALANVWDALRRRTEETGDHDCVFYPGPRNIGLLTEASTDDIQHVRRAIAAAWVSEWLFAGEFLPQARASRPPERWQSVPVVRILRRSAADTAELLGLAVASDSDDLLQPATRLVKSIAGLHLSEESILREKDELRRDEDALRDMSWVLEEQARQTSEIVSELQRSGELPVVSTYPFPHAPRFPTLSDRREGSRGRGPTPHRARTPVREAVRAANTAIRSWASEFIVLPEPVASSGPLRDRYASVRARDAVQEIESDTLEVSLGNLSTAQARWIGIAISFLARRILRPDRTDGRVRWEMDPHVILILDEPERSLHRGAERDVLARLERLVTHENSTAIIATHSPILLDSETVALHHVRMVDGLISVESGSEGGASLDQIADRIGGRRSDVAALHRLFLLVEGEVDRQVVMGLFGDELDELRVSVVPMAGTDALHTAVTPFALLGLTDAAVTILLDHVDDGRMRDVWAQATTRMRDRGSEAAVRWLESQRFDRSAERTAAQLLATAMRIGEYNRVRILGIPAIDILELVPFELLGCRETRATFDAAVAAEAAAGRRWTSKKTKDWLRAHGADITIDGIRAAVAQMDAIPPELARVGTEIRERALHARNAFIPADDGSVPS